MERTFQSVAELEQKQNEVILTTHQQLIAAMMFPEPTMTKFNCDPIEYMKFVMAFDAQICSKATTDTNLLYYLISILKLNLRSHIRMLTHGP